ncbi:MAG: glycosyltransferase [Chloroherpetonaceae bacterium]|nr:glycosyltransferase [Chthonomonadaceae bacterium]MDW8207616.1 glycosyltransferase [Chloroherpetonaceae bacterium]
MRILMGYRDITHTHIDRSRYDVRCVMPTREGEPVPSIAAMLEQCPPGWKPDVYYHAAVGHHPLPADIDVFPGLLVCDVQDWDRRARACWAGVGFFDLAFSDTGGCALLRSWGYQNAHFARLYSLRSDEFRLLPDTHRDIDVLFVGSFGSPVWSDRNRWLHRVARLADRYRVVITQGRHGAEYVRLNNRARIVFNRSVRGETNARVYEAALCGALVFMERENEETHQILEEGVHAVYYDAASLEALLEHYLQHEEERARIAMAGRQRILEEHTETAHLHTLFAQIEQHLQTRYRPYTSLPSVERHARKALQIFAGAYPAAVPMALACLDRARRIGHTPAQWLTARAALMAWQADTLGGASRLSMLEEARQLAAQAVQSPGNSLFDWLTYGTLCLVCSGLRHGQFTPDDPDVATGREMLERVRAHCQLRLYNPEALDVSYHGMVYPHWGDLFDGFQDRAFRHRGVDDTAWKREMLQAILWQCCVSLSDLAAGMQDWRQAEELAGCASEVHPDQSETWFRQGLYAAMGGRLENAAAYYRQGLDVAPLTPEMWENYVSLLVRTGQRARAEAFVAECLTVLRAVPGMDDTGQHLVQALR